MTRPALAALVASLTAFTPTPQSDDFPSGNGTGTVGATIQATLDPGQAFDNVYTVHYFATVTINGNSSTFGSASLTVAIETNDGSGWVERATALNSCSYLSGPPPWPTRTCTFSHEQVSINVVGLGLNSLIRLKAKSFTTPSGVGGSFFMRGGDGTGTNPETYNGVTYSYDPAPPPTYTVAVTPDGGNQSAWVSSTGNVATFSVQNQGNQDGVVYNLSVVGCTAPLTNCTSDVPSVTVNHAATVNATVHFDMQSTTGTGTITLRATHAASGATNDGTINVFAMSAAVAVGPDPGSQTVGANMTGNVATFTVQNNGNQGTLTYALSVVTCGAPLINCTSDVASVSVGQGATVNTSVHFDATSSTGTGAIVLRATHTASGTSDDGTINVTVNPASFAVQVGPDPGSQGALMPSTGNVAMFTVQNQGNQGTLAYNLSVVSCGAPLTNCTSDAASVSVGQGSTANATVHFDVQNMAGTGAIVLRATHAGSGATNDGTINVTATMGRANDFTAGNGIAAVGQTAEATLNPGNANSGLYTVHYFLTLTINGNSSTYGSASLAGVIESNDGSGWVQRGTFGQNCGYPSGPPPYATTTCSWAHLQQAIAATGLGLNAQIRLRATSLTTNNGSGASFLVRGGDGAGSNPETYNGVTYATDVPASYAVEVGPDPGSQAAFTSQTGLVATFTVQNNGNQGTLTYQLSVQTCTTPPLASCTADVGSVAVGQGATVNATVHFNTQSTAGSGTITLRATHVASGTYNEGTIAVTVTVPPSYAVAVTPDGGTQSTSGGTTGNVATFTVQNNGNQGLLTYALSVVGCPAPLTNCTADVPSMSVAQGASQNATVHFDAQNMTGTGTITLRATHTASGTSNDGTITVSVVTLSSVTGGVFTIDSRLLLQETALIYDDAGRIKRLSDGRGSIAEYEYGPSAYPNDGFLTRVKRWKNSTGSSYLSTDIGYTAGNVTSIRDEGGTLRAFVYDGWGRLVELKNNGSPPDGQQTIKRYTYTYSRSAPAWTFQSGSPNALTETVYLKGGATPVTVVNIQYFDGLGRPIQSQVQDGGTYHVTATQYDLMGRTSRVWRAFPRSGPGFDSNFDQDATAFYNGYHSTSLAHPFTETRYRADALNRVSQVYGAYISASPSDTVFTSYGIENNLQVTEVADESHKKTRNNTDGFDYLKQTILGVGSADAATTSFSTDILGQRTQATDPRGLVTTYATNTRGLQIGRTSPDAGTIGVKYDALGNRRYNQDANQADSGKVYFTLYDSLSRAVASGVAPAGFASLDGLAPPQAFETTRANWLIARRYDVMPPADSLPWNLFPTPPSLLNIAGRLVGVASRSNNAWQVTYFSYDAEGQLATRYTYTQANGGGAPPPQLNTTIAYTRDLRGSMTQRTLTVGANSFYQWYDYDARGLLVKVFASTTKKKPTTADVVDTILSTGQPKNYQFQNGPVVPLRYTIRGQTDRIGDPTQGTCQTCPFSAHFAYQPNGVIDTAEFYNAGTPAPAAKHYRYVFGALGYDYLNRLKKADYSTWNGSSWVATAAYGIQQITYDPSGNLRHLQRYNDAASLIDDLSYSISPSSNRLDRVDDLIANTPEPWDAESGAFTYDANGNLKTAAPYSITGVTYDVQNLPLSISTSGGGTSNYRYDETGQRIAKQAANGSSDYYLREGSTTVAVVTLNGTSPAYFNILWENRVVGRQVVGGNRSYYHFDILSSTRSVVLSTGAIVESYDFDPWGLRMPGRTLTIPNPTKEGFGSKEQDPETGLDYFGARYYMPAIGRWSSVDPLADKAPAWSTYAYTYDNPVGFVDPTGRQPCYYVAGGYKCEGVAAQELVRQYQREQRRTPLQRHRACQDGRAGNNVFTCLGAVAPAIPKLLVVAEGVTIVVGGTVGLGMYAVGAEGASITTLNLTMNVTRYAVPIGVVLGKNTDRLIQMIQEAGPALEARRQAVMAWLNSIPANLGTQKALQFGLENGGEMLQGGVAEKGRQIFMLADGTTIIKARDAVTGAWELVAKIGPGQ